MIFETLIESAERGELMLVDGGMCHWHLRRDGQLTVREIIVTPERRGQGVGMAMLAQLKTVPGALSVYAKCPADLSANGWYAREGFECEGVEITKTGREMNLWRLRL